MSKNPRLSVVRANFGGSGAKRKLEAESTRDVAHHFPFFARLEFPAYLFVYLVCGAKTDIKMEIPVNVIITIFKMQVLQHAQNAAIYAKNALSIK